MVDYFNTLHFDLDAFIDRAIQEDIGEGDHTSLACVPSDKEGKAQLLVKQDGVIAGVALATIIFSKIDPKLQVEILIPDGSAIKIGDVALTVAGNTQSILKAERLVLNCMQRMSGVATLTRYMVEKCTNTKAQVIDTRKTTPGFRFLEKWAVKIGGGENHRFGLYDMVMIKDNHVDYSGGIQNAIETVDQYLKEKGKVLKVEIEVRSFDELEEVLNTGKVDRIMLDNFSVADTAKAVAQIAGKYEVESSGGITAETLQAYAECGVDYISVGALTHSYTSLDLSLKAI